MFPSTFVEMSTQNSKFLAGNSGLRDRVLQTSLPCLQKYITLSVFHNVLDATTRQSLLAKWLTLQIA